MSKEKLVPKLRFKDYNREWISKKISDISNITYGGGTPRTSVIEYWEGSIPWISSSDLKEDIVYNVIPSRYITKDAITNSATKLVPKNSIAVVTRVGVGKLSLIPFKYTTSQDFLSISNIKENELYSVYTLYKLLQVEKNTTQGTSIKGITKDELLDKKIYITTNKKEQRKIGDFFKNIDEMIQLQQSKVNKVKDIKSAYLSEMFPKEGEKYPKKRVEGFNEPWELMRFSDIAEVERGLTYHPSNIVESGGVRVLRSSNIDDDTFITKDDDVFVSKDAINISFAEKQDILITSANGSPRLVGKHAILNALDTQSVHGGFMLLAKTDKPYFLNASMSSDWYRKFINYHVAGGGGSIGNIKKSDLEKQLIYVPSEEEQEKIGQFFKNLDKQILIEEEKLAKLENLKQAYLNDMFV